MASARGVQNFMQAIGKSGGISASNLYQFSFAKKPKLAKFFEDNLGEDFLKLTDNGDELNLQLLCNEIQLPGVTYSAFDVKSVHKGITQKMATAKVYNELDLSFFMDGTSLPLKFFRAWQDFTQNGVAANPEFFYDDQPYKRAFASNYYEDYACDMFISKLEKFKGSAQEKRDENGNVKKIQIYPQKSKSMNLAFDITPAKYVTALITEKGICKATTKGLEDLFNK